MADLKLETHYRDLGIKWQYDDQAKAGYLSLNDGDSARTEWVTSAIGVDFTPDGRVLGVEFLGLGEMPDWLTLARVLRWIDPSPAASGSEEDG